MSLRGMLWPGSSRPDAASERSRLLAPFGEYYADLTATVLLTLATVAFALLPVVSETSIRAVVGLAFVLFAPGWALVAALFPGAPGVDSDDADDSTEAAPGAGDDGSGAGADADTGPEAMADDLSGEGNELDDLLAQVDRAFEEFEEQPPDPDPDDGEDVDLAALVDDVERDPVEELSASEWYDIAAARAAQEDDDSTAAEADGDTDAPSADEETATAPEPGDDTRTVEEAIPSTVDPRLSGVERLALSMGVGVAVVVLAGLTLNYTPWPIALRPILGSLGGITLLCTAIGAVRRQRLAPPQRFRVPVRELRGALSGVNSTRGDRVLNVVLVLSVLLLVGTMGFTLATPAPDDRYTNFWVLTEDDDGDLVAENYTDALEPGEEIELVVGVENNEYEAQTYTVVAQVEAVERTGSGIAVVDRQELDRAQQTIGHNQTWQLRQEVELADIGDDLRVKYLLYRGDAPATPFEDSAYRHVHLWVSEDVGPEGNLEGGPSAAGEESTSGE